MSNLPFVIDIADCRHSRCQEPDGLVLISVGNCLRRDDGISQKALDQLAGSTLKACCRFDLGSHTNHLPSCLAHHKAGIVIDSTQNGLLPGTISIVDLNELLKKDTQLKIQSCHGFSLVDELRIASKYSRLPAKLIFFGIEVEDVNFGAKISQPLESKLPEIVEELSELIEILLKRLSGNARIDNSKSNSGKDKSATRAF